MLLGAAVAACGVVAALMAQPVWGAVVGSGLVLVYWGLEALTWRRARNRDDLALGVAIGGMFTRLVVVLTALIVVGLLARPAFAAAAISFLASFTIYMMLRPFTYPQATPPAGQARVQ